MSGQADEMLGRICEKDADMFGFLTSKTQGKAAPRQTQKAKRAISSDTVVIDVRDYSEIQSSGKIKGAKHIPLSRLADIADARHPDHDPDLRGQTPLAVYCAAGGRAGLATQLLLRLGYENVSNIGGFAQLVEQGFDVA